MSSLSVHNARYCPNRACTVVVFRKVVINVCPKCETPGIIVHSMTMGMEKEK
jgi:hypothetical protein